MDKKSEASIRDIAKDLREYCPSSWRQMPDIELYMDQVITYLKRQFSVLQEERDANLVTPSIINNYVKDGIAPRPVKKKYAREQLASLIMACLLKRAMPISSVKELVTRNGRGADEESYEGFRAELQEVLGEESETLLRLLEERPEADGEKDLYATALRFALRAGIERYIADRLLELARDSGRGESNE